MTIGCFQLRQFEAQVFTEIVHKPLLRFGEPLALLAEDVVDILVTEFSEKGRIGKLCQPLVLWYGYSKSIWIPVSLNQ